MIAIEWALFKYPVLLVLLSVVYCVLLTIIAMYELINEVFLT